MIDIYHFQQIWVKFLPVKINVVVLISTHTKTGKTARKVLFSTDLKLSADFIIEFYCLRFQIEFNFRDAKQHFGLADFRAYKKKQVNNSVGLAFFMVNFTHIVRKKVTEKHQLEQISIIDLKACFRAEKYVFLILNLIGLETDKFNYDDKIISIAAQDAINLT